MAHFTSKPKMFLKFRICFKYLKTSTSGPSINDVLYFCLMFDPPPPRSSNFDKPIRRPKSYIPLEIYVFLSNMEKTQKLKKKIYSLFIRAIGHFFSIHCRFVNKKHRKAEFWKETFFGRFCMTSNTFRPLAPFSRRSIRLR